MPPEPITINKTIQRRFILGVQGLWPGRRWRGKTGALEALRSGSVIQIDPLQVIARNHDLTLQARVLDYTPAILSDLLYEDRACLEYGGIVRISPIEQLPCLRVVMARRADETRWAQFLQEHRRAIERVRAEIREHGALSSMDIEPEVTHKSSWWSGKDTGRALYYLWTSGELLIKQRNGTGKVFDLRERLAPGKYDRIVKESTADDFYALKAFRQLNIATIQEWRLWFAGLIERKVTRDEALERIAVLESKSILQRLTLEEEQREPRYMLAKDLPLLEELLTGHLPDAWQPLETTTEQEVTILAPLEIVSARGRARKIFDFDYVWEVYKPAAQRRWGYYTLPVLYGDRLVARFDAKLERSTMTLQVKGFWLEEGQKLDRRFTSALKKGIQRFMVFCGAGQIDYSGIGSSELGEMHGKLIKT
ncbi:MAG: YcaQ family DNA glycosylase [Anaerolineaceae bacterium]|nr:YcaQ family DNA glycosylase [Anaerolineaceae bacterium]MBN2676583.1 YcaQ family DNA glycosylase [Anaerolineaceae bacterium]